MNSSSITKENLDRNYPNSSNSSSNHLYYSIQGGSSVNVMNSSLFSSHMSHQDSHNSSLGTTASSFSSSILSSSKLDSAGYLQHNSIVSNDHDDESMDETSLNMAYFGGNGMLSGNGTYMYPVDTNHSHMQVSQSTSTYPDYMYTTTSSSSSSLSGAMKQDNISSRDNMMKGTGSDHSDNYSSGDGSDNEEIQSEKEKYKAKNREHAKNTRRRKKGFIDTLKQSLESLTHEQEQLDSDRRIILSRMAEQMTVRKQVLQMMLQFRAQGETDVSRWRTILDESIVMTLPITPYRSFPPIEVNNNQRRIIGIEAVIADTASFAMMVQCITSSAFTNKKDYVGKAKVIVQYVINANDIAINDDRLMSKVMLQSLNAVELGARHEISIACMIRASYTNQNKLASIDMTFDVMTVMQQLRRASGRSDFLIVPNTLLIAQEPSTEARVVVEAIAPHRIIFVNKSWCDLFGYRASQVLNTTCDDTFHDVESSTRLPHHSSKSDPNIRNNGTSSSPSSSPPPSASTSSLSSSTTSSELYDRIAHVHKTGRPNFSLIGMSLSSVCPHDVKCQSKLYPLYSVDLNISVTHVLIVMDVIALPTHSRSKSSKSSRSSTSSSTSSRKHQRNSTSSPSSYTTNSSPIDMNTHAMIDDTIQEKKPHHNHHNVSVSGKLVSSSVASTSSVSTSTISIAPSTSIPTITASISPLATDDNRSLYDSHHGFDDFFNDDYDNLIYEDGYNDMWIDQYNSSGGRSNSSSNGTSSSDTDKGR